MARVCFGSLLPLDKEFPATMSTNAMQFQWLSGWLSGHGYILTTRNTVRIEGSSCDRSLVQHVQSIAGGKVYQRPSDRRGRRKQNWRWQVAGDRAVELLAELEPLLAGNRHRAKIASLSNREMQIRQKRKTL